MELPTDEDLRKAVDAPDLLRMVIRGHGEIEAALRLAIMEALVEPHALEVERLGFPLKVDLAIALGTLRRDLRPLLLKLNQFRNDFAHDPRADISENAARDLQNTFPERHRVGVAHHLQQARKPRDILRIALVVAFFETRGAAITVREKWPRKSEQRYKWKLWV